MPVRPAVTAHAPARRAGRFAHWGPAYVVFVFMAGANVPTPLYGVYRQMWGFSPATLTAIFAVYAIALVVALLVSGSASDAVGRRPVLLCGLATALVATLVFASARSTAWLLVARLLQGAAAGVTLGAATAALVELHPASDGHRAGVIAAVMTMTGGAVGPLMSGLVAQLAPLPLVLPYVVYAVALVAGVAVVAAMPESVDPATAPAWRARRPSIPPRILRGFLVASAGGFTLWAAAGLFLSLGPILLASLLPVRSLALGGALLFVFSVASGLTQLLLRGVPARRALPVGLALLVLGLWLAVAAVLGSAAPLFGAGTALVGVGHGLAFMGSMGMVSSMAPARARAEVLAAFYVVLYAGVSLPVLGLGVLASAIDFTAAIVVFASFVTALGALSIGAHGLGRARA